MTTATVFEGKIDDGLLVAVRIYSGPPLRAGRYVCGSGIPVAVKILGQLSGIEGSVGKYQISPEGSTTDLPSQTMLATEATA